MPPESESGLDRIEKRLYGNRQVDIQVPDALRAGQAHNTEHVWENEPVAPVVMPREHKKPSFAVLFFSGAALFLVIASALAIFLLLSDERSVSTKNITVNMQGPTTIAAGDTVPIAFSIENHNPTALLNPDFIVTFPEGTRSATDVTQSYPRYEEKLDDIPAGGRVERTVKAVLFGEEGNTITVPVEITYRTDGSNAVFKKDVNYQVTVSTSPIALTVTTLSQTVSGQQFTIDLSVRSNATTPISNVVLSTNYPFGFTPISSTIPTSDSGLISIGTLNPGQTKDVKITGTLTGTGNDASIFQFAAGTAGSDGSLAVTYTSKQAQVGIEAPFLAVDMAVNDSTEDNPVITPGEPVNVSLDWTNTLPDEVDNAELVVHLQGAAIDPSTVNVTNGFYQSSDNTIHFDSTNNDSLSALAPGATGQGSFTFTPTSVGSQGAVTISVSIDGQRIGESSVPESVSGTVSKTLKLASSLALSSSLLHTTGGIPNSGPIPPKHDTPTTYTILWKLSNVVNAIGSGQVTATLPTYVTWTGNTSTNTGAVSYNAASHTVTWNVGDLGQKAGTVQAEFQVSYTPSVSQEGTKPELTSDATFSGYDRFAQTTVSASAQAPDTGELTDTPASGGEDPGIVQ